MKVLVLGSYLRGAPATNGIIVHVTNLVKELSRYDLDLHLITLGNENGFYQEGKLKVHVVKRVIKNKDSPLDVIRINKKIGEIGPEIIHAHSTWYPYSTALLTVGKKYARLLTIHGNLKKEFRYWKKSMISYPSIVLGVMNEFAVLRSINNVIIVSPVLEKHLKLTGKRVFKVPNGFNFDENSFTKASCSEKKRSDLLFIGSLTYIKGCDILIRSLSIVKKRYPEVKVLIAGSGPCELEFKTLAKDLGLDDNVAFIGYIDGVEKFSYIKSTGICIIPSRSDMAPSTIFEAMAAKKPVIASSVAGIPYIVDDGVTGLLFEAENEKDLAEKILSLLDDNANAVEIGIRGEVKLRREYDWKKVALETHKIYESLLG